MVRTIKTPDSKAIATLINTALVPDIKSVTNTLKNFERIYETYPLFQQIDAEEIYRTCIVVIQQHTKDALLRYNALRLLKFAMTTEDLLRVHAEDIWSLYKETIFDPNGNIRNAGLQLMSRYRFGMSFIADSYQFRKRKYGKKRAAEIKHFQKMLIEQCIELFEIERTYREQHSYLEELQEELLNGIPRGSWDTKDKYLKTIRRGMEEVTRGIFIEKLAEKHGYQLPQHWLFDGQVQEQVTEWPPGTEGDIAGILIDPAGTQPVIISDPPNPKSFSSFEEYQEALTVRDEFLEKAEAISTVLSSCKSEEEIAVAMEALGFEPRDDAPCNRPWCIDRYGCVSVTLIELLQDIEAEFFDTPLSPEQQLLSEKDIEQCILRGCHALPPAWFAENARECTVFRWFMNLMGFLIWNERKVPFASLSQDSLESAFVREAYLFTLSALRGHSWKQQHEGKGLIEAFLTENDLLQPEDARNLLQEFKGSLLRMEKVHDFA